MQTSSNEWKMAYEGLIQTITALGFTEELGYMVAKNLGSPNAIRRMTSYLSQVKPKKEEFVVDEMLAIMSDIAAWREKKASEQANALYNEILNYGFDEE